MLVCVFLCMFAHETAGAACIRRSLRPLISEGRTFQESLAQIMRRDREAVSDCRYASLSSSPTMTPSSLQQIPTRSARGGAMLAERLDDVAADPPFMDLVGTVDQPLRAHLGVPFRQRRILAEAERAVELDRGVDYVMHHVRQIHFCDRVF